jgi:hypothetical protein
MCVGVAMQCLGVDLPPVLEPEKLACPERRVVEMGEVVDEHRLRLHVADDAEKQEFERVEACEARSPIPFHRRLPLDEWQARDRDRARAPE